MSILWHAQWHGQKFFKRVGSFFEIFKKILWTIFFESINLIFQNIQENYKEKNFGKFLAYGYTWQPKLRGKRSPILLCPPSARYC